VTGQLPSTEQRNPASDSLGELPPASAMISVASSKIQQRYGPSRPDRRHTPERASATVPADEGLPRPDAIVQQVHGTHTRCHRWLNGAASPTLPLQALYGIR
jgi:hypothetical protein